jgi:hypothetical protein
MTQPTGRERPRSFSRSGIRLVRRELDGRPLDIRGADCGLFPLPAFIVHQATGTISGLVRAPVMGAVLAEVERECIQAASSIGHD